MLSPDLATVAAQLPALRFTALELLAEASGGDRLVAEYLLLQLVSRCGTSARGKWDSSIESGCRVIWTVIQLKIV